jgi:sugar phosphate isomerase/epimerase
MSDTQFTRRQFNSGLASTLTATAIGSWGNAADPPSFRLQYIVASCMYGQAPLAEILPEVSKTGADHIEIWAAPHGNQREQIDEIGPAAFRELLQQNHVKLGSFTCFKYGIFDMQGEMQFVKDLGGDLVICNSRGPKDLTGDELRTEVRMFADQLRPHVEHAEQVGVTIGVENHSGGLISSPDSQRWLLDLIPSHRLGIALAPYHLPQDATSIGRLITDLGERLVHFQAWEHGMGCMTKLPKEQELLQLPHRGPLDWRPILAALKKIHYAGRTEIFMHPFPRGIPILESTPQVTAEINAAREFLEQRLGEV